MNIRFRWMSAFLNIYHYEVLGDGAPYRIETRHPIAAAQNDYQRAIFNGTEEEWQRDVIAATNLLFRATEIDRPLSRAVVDAFNAWRAAEHQRAIGEIRENPAKYGEIEQNDPVLTPPPIVRGAHYVVGQGWVVDEPIALKDGSIESKAGRSDVLEILNKLPPEAFTVLNSDPCLVIGLRRGMSGYVPLCREATEAEARSLADKLNEGAASTAQIAAMEAGSLFGWEVPAADPDRYGADGKLKRDSRAATGAPEATPS
jgi:hypothetical protein